MRRGMGQDAVGWNAHRIATPSRPSLYVVPRRSGMVLLGAAVVFAALLGMVLGRLLS